MMRVVAFAVHIGDHPAKFYSMRILYIHVNSIAQPSI